MRIEFLGTGGAVSTPRPTCQCRVCSEARGRGVPYSRMGPAVFVHGPDLLIDTPEDIGHALNRANIRRIGAATWSHWHPDHTFGLRVFEMNFRFLDWPPSNEVTPVYIPEGVWADFERQGGLAGQVDYLANQLRVIETHFLPDGEAFTPSDGVTVTPFRLPVETANVYAFILEEGSKRIFIAPDELVSWQPAESLGRFDLAVLAVGICEFDPFSGERRIPAEHPALRSEATFRQTLDIVRALDADRVLFTHIEELDGLSYDDLMRLQRQLMRDQPDLGNVMFAFDRLSVSV